MKVRSSFYLWTLLLSVLFFSNKSQAQCVQIESILVAACSPQDLNQEGYNEMVRFKIGNTAQNTNALEVDWPSNPWRGLIQNSITATKVAQLNANILAAGGCGQLVEPTGNILPANATVILITSHLFDVPSNSFGALNETYYIIFQNNPSTTGGHFGNYNASPGTRTLEISFGSCSDSATYQRASLSQQMGATVNFTPSGSATYVNNGCSAPIPPFMVDAGNSPAAACPGNTVNLLGNALGYTTIEWSATSGTFSATNILNPIFTIPSTATGSITATLTATNSCGNSITDTVVIDIAASATPNFDLTTLNLCTGSTAPTLNNTSPNGIVGTWSPATISNTASGTYTFTPNPGQCSVQVSFDVNITSGMLPDFDLTTLTICQGTIAPTLATTSPNGVVGTWSPATISNTANGSYTFTPNPGQCADPVTLLVIVTASNIVPDFNTTPITICTGNSAPILELTSPNGVSGVWFPAVISNTTSNTYTFTPNAGQCAIAVSIDVTVTSSITPNFDLTTIELCEGSTAPSLNTTSPNGIVGIWSPSIISNTTSGAYTFTPNTGQCAVSVTLQVNVTNNTIPNFDLTPVNICAGAVTPTLNTISPNGISGTWSPSVISNTISNNYTFTPNAGQCSSPVTLEVNVANSTIPNFDLTPITICNGSVAPTLSTTSPNGIIGTWSPALINNTSSATYTFTPNAGQCANSVTLQVTVENKVTPSFDVNPINICNGANVPTLNTTSPNGITGTWSPSVIDTTNTGTYTFTPNAGQCATSVSLQVNITTFFIASIIGENAICIGESTVLTNASLNGVWSSSNENVATVDQNGNVVSLSIGQTIITYEVNDNGCIGTATKTIDVVAIPNPVMADQAICQDPITGEIFSHAMIDSNIPANGQFIFEWKLDGNVLTNNTAIIEAYLPGLYEVTVTHIVSGCSGTAQSLVTVVSPATATATVDYEMDLRQTITVNVVGGSGDYMYQLENGPLQSSNIFYGIYSGDYTIRIIDLKGCEDIFLNVLAINYPRFFTPNNDGFNDTWNIKDIADQPNAIIYIFDRFGKVMKEIKPSGAGWDGTYNGINQPSTDYWFKLFYQDKNGIDREFKSHFSLKR